uniref:Cadherin 15, type 1, M-cadherin (myotubule) n=1 Tax=Eptatretus burgeri TaxID=7764 RepID=A0A8C4NP91_EPTBU
MSDKEVQGNITYSIEGAGVDPGPIGPFSIRRNTGKIFVEKPLDREERDCYQVKVYALESPEALVEDSIEISIVVLDINDNCPIFSQPIYNGNVTENAEPGTFVMSTTAHDADDPNTPNGDLRYSIVKQQPGIPSPDLFSIDQFSGDVRTLISGLDRELMSCYTLILQVVDMAGDSNSLSHTATASIVVQDANDNEPRFTRDSLELSVMEGNMVELGRLTVLDADMHGSSAWQAHCTLTEMDTHSFFSVDTDPESNECVIGLVQPLDFESAQTHIFKITVTNDEPPVSGAALTGASSTIITVRVQDRNEPPAFLNESLHISVNEHHPIGHTVAFLTAIDPDCTNPPQQLKYFLLHDPEGWLDVESVSGRVRSRHQLDKHSTSLQNSTYAVLITVQDDGNPPLSATGTLHIELQEENDFAPRLVTHASTLCGEQSDEATGVIVSATDDDLHPHGAPFTFRLHPNWPELALNWSLIRLNGTHAEVKPHSGRVPDGTHSIMLQLSDSGQPPRLSVDILNVTACECDITGLCAQHAAMLRSTPGLGLSWAALIAIIVSVLLFGLLVVVKAVTMRRCTRPHPDIVLIHRASSNDLRENAVNYDEQGGGEQDQDAFDVTALRVPSCTMTPVAPPGTPWLQRPYQLQTGKPAGGPFRLEDMGNFINQSIDMADRDAFAPPFDSYLLYDFEGIGSLASSLSSLKAFNDDGSEADYEQMLKRCGPQFHRVTNLFGSDE